MYGDDFFPDDFSTLGPKQREDKWHVERNYRAQGEAIKLHNRLIWEANARAAQQPKIIEEQSLEDQEQERLMAEHNDVFWRLVDDDQGPVSHTSPGHSRKRAHPTCMAPVSQKLANMKHQNNDAHNHSHA